MREETPAQENLLAILNTPLMNISRVPAAGRRQPAPSMSLRLRFAPVRFEDLEGAEQAGVDVHERAGVVELAAVVGRREYGDELPVGEELVAVLHDLQWEQWRFI